MEFPREVYDENYPEVVVVAIACTSLLKADIIHVPADTATIQGGIYLATEGDTVLVAENTYYENINFKGKAITVASLFIMDGDTSHKSRTIIDGSKPVNPDSGSVVYFISGEDSSSILNGFTITGGSGSYTVFFDEFWSRNYEMKIGGGILAFNSGLTIINNIIKDNVADFENSQKCPDGAFGGGITIFNSSWDLTLDRRIIVENNIVKSNTIIAGKNSGGGGIYYLVWNQGLSTFRYNKIIGNKVFITESDWKAQGGGLWIDATVPTAAKVIIANNVISGNELHCENSFGGGLSMLFWQWNSEYPYDHDPNPLVYNNIIKDNYSQDRGGGIEVWTAYDTTDPRDWDVLPQPAIINNTVVNNQTKKGSGIFLYRSHPLIMNTILWNDLSEPSNTEIDYSNVLYWGSNFASISIYNSFVRDGNWNDIENKVFATDPLFANSNFNLSENSPAIGMGRKKINVDDAIYETFSLDFDGKNRPNAIDSLIDIGAIESPYPANEFVYPKLIEVLEGKTYLIPTSERFNIISEIINPDHHNLNVFAITQSVDDVLRDSTELTDDGSHNDREAGDLVFGGEAGPFNEENEFKILGYKGYRQGHIFYIQWQRTNYYNWKDCYFRYFDFSKV